LILANFISNLTIKLIIKLVLKFKIGNVRPLLGSCQIAFAVRRKILKIGKTEKAFPIPYYIL